MLLKTFNAGVQKTNKKTLSFVTNFLRFSRCNDRYFGHSHCFFSDSDAFLAGLHPSDGGDGIDGEYHQRFV